MKVLLINTLENRGGAAIACKRLMKSLKKQGISAKMLVRDKQSVDPDVVSISETKLKKKINGLRFVTERLVIWLTNCFSKKNLFAVSIANTGTDITKLPEVEEADIIHLHWINQGMLSLEDIHRLLELGKPVVWTMHDMWPMTGICHHARLCSHYTQSCGDCFFLKLSGKKDLSFRVFQKKLHMGYEKIFFIACSNWLKSKAEISHLLKFSKIACIPNPLDTKLFLPLNKREVRKMLGLPLDKYYLLFGAAKMGDVRKGFEYYFEALQLLHRKMPQLSGKLELIFMGEAGLELPAEIPYRAHFTGFLTEEKELADWYNAVDLFILPSLEENLPNMIMESMSCGTPVVGFDVGGIPEMIDHRINGYIACYRDSYDLMEGIIWCLLKANYSELSFQARKKVENSYPEEKIAVKYLNLYRTVLGI